MNYFESIYNQGLEKNAEYPNDITYRELLSGAYIGDKQAKQTLKALARSNPDLIRKYENRTRRLAASGIVGAGGITGMALGGKLIKDPKKRGLLFGSGIGALAGVGVGAVGAAKYLHKTKGNPDRVIELLKRYGTRGSIQEDFGYKK